MSPVPKKKPVARKNAAKGSAPKRGTTRTRKPTEVEAEAATPVVDAPAKRTRRKSVETITLKVRGLGEDSAAKNLDGLRAAINAITEISPLEIEVK